MEKSEVYFDCGSDDDSPSTLSSPEHLEENLRLVKRIKSSTITFDDVCGMDEAKEKLKLPLYYHRSPERIGRISFFLFGPPGTGKTRIMEALVGEARSRLEAQSITFLTVSLPDVTKAERPNVLLRQLFERAYFERPCYIFIEKVDGLASENFDAEITRHGFIKELKNLKDGVFVVATSNQPQKLLKYPDVVRHFLYSIYLSLPHEYDRLKMLKMFFNCHTCLREQDLEELASTTRGLSGYDIRDMRGEAYRRASRRVRGTCQEVVITKHDIVKVKYFDDPDLASFRKLYEITGASNCNLVLEPLVKMKFSITERLWACLSEIFF